MSYLYKNPHGIMFHHFHGEGHSESQGSISASQFKSLVAFLGQEHNLLSASEFHKRYLVGALTDHDICLTFDDGLRCQYDIAAPILNELNLTAFFFVYSSIFTEQPDLFEIYRSFRHKCFSDINEFYDHFFNIFLEKNNIDRTYLIEEFQTSDYLLTFDIYSYEDRLFRYVRDVILNRKTYGEIMQEMMRGKGFDIEFESSSLWMSEVQVEELSSRGHIIGLHSHTHPTNMHAVPAREQKIEYETNARLLREVVKSPICSMAHPCGSYNDNTLQILEAMNITIGFRSNLDFVQNRSVLEVPRCDHAALMAALKK